MQEGTGMRSTALSALLRKHIECRFGGTATLKLSLPGCLNHDFNVDV